MPWAPGYGILEAPRRCAMAGPYDELPEPIDFDKLVTSAETEPVPDPEGGIDPERQFMLRWAALG
ncbi:MAG TPA: hypothetical protein VFR22_14190 [Nocardioidaceae bacterium]|nr:hypothetical protein [Nocardioidaceae bacterium]